jgi:hypothetical protein
VFRGHESLKPHLACNASPKAALDALRALELAMGAYDCRAESIPPGSFISPRPRLGHAIFRDANTGASQGITDLAAAVQLRLRVAIGLQTFTVKSRLLTGENVVQFCGNPPNSAAKLLLQQRSGRSKEEKRD